jgi:hypothetical protein
MKVLFALLATTSVVLAQDNVALSQTEVQDTPSSLTWATFGIGYVANRQFPGFGGGICVSHQSKLGLLSIRFIGAYDASVEPTILTDTKLTQIYELSGMYGVRYSLGPFQFAGSTGLGVVQWSERSRFGRSHTNTMGVPLDIQVSVLPLQILGLGVHVLGNLNPRSSYAAGFLCLQVGRVR